MSNFSKNLIAFVAAIVAVAVIFGGLGYYIDNNFGDGTSALVGAVLVGAVIAITITTLTMTLNNRTHQSAGDDITAFAEAMAKTDAVRARTHQELARLQREVTVIDAKKDFETHKDGLRRDSREWIEAKRVVDREEAERNRQRQSDEQQANESQWYYTGHDADSPVDVELQ